MRVSTQRRTSLDPFHVSRIHEAVPSSPPVMRRATAFQRGKDNRERAVLLWLSPAVFPSSFQSAPLQAQVCRGRRRVASRHPSLLSYATLSFSLTSGVTLFLASSEQPFSLIPLFALSRLESRPDDARKAVDRKHGVYRGGEERRREKSREERVRRVRSGIKCKKRAIVREHLTVG